jgi:hypothetical protein
MGNGDAHENITDPQESEVPASNQAPRQHPKQKVRISPSPPPTGLGGVGGSTSRKGGAPGSSDPESTEWQTAPGAEALDISTGTAQHGKGGSSGP